MKHLYSIILVALGLSMVACNTKNEVVSIPVTDMNINATSLNLAIGQTASLTADLTPSNTTDTLVTWVSSNEAVATVTPLGTVTAVAEGEATVLATAVGGIVKPCLVKVYSEIIPVTDLQLVGAAERTLYVGDKETVETVVTPANTTQGTLVWTSSNPEVVSVSASGEVEALRAGRALVIGATQDREFDVRVSYKIIASSFEVTFVTNGAPAMDPITVKNGEAFAKPADPVRPGLLVEGLYEGEQNPEDASYDFLGWFVDAACTIAYDFSSPVTADLTLYAKWSETAAPINLDDQSGATLLHKAMSYLNAQTLSETTKYTFVLASDIITGATLNLSNDFVEIRIVGTEAPRTIKMTSNNTNLFSTDGGHFIFGNNIVLTALGHAINLSKDNNNADKANWNSKATMLEGSKITGCVAPESVVFMTGNAYFYLAGGEIVDNTIASTGNFGAPIVASWWQRVDISGGKIANNTVTVSKAGATASGAVVARRHWDSHFVKTGGVVENNTVGIAEGASITASEVLAAGQMIYGLFSNVGTSTPVYYIDQNMDEKVTFDINQYTSYPSPWKKYE